jgi:hypothetical protein
MTSCDTGTFHVRRMAVMTYRGTYIYAYMHTFRLLARPNRTADGRDGEGDICLRVRIVEGKIRVLVALHPIAEGNALL